MTVSLLNSVSTGGNIARRGFEYQDAWVLEHIPEFLASGSFGHIISEALADIEICYAPTGTMKRVACEAKNHDLSEKKFWEEIQNFKYMYDAEPTQFIKFQLICPSYNASTSPFVHGLRKLKSHGAAYNSESIIIQESEEFLRLWASKHDIKLELSKFAIEHVEFLTYSSDGAELSFIGKLNLFFPQLDLRNSQSDAICVAFKSLVQLSSKKPVTRSMLEEILLKVVGLPFEKWRGTPLRLDISDTFKSHDNLGVNVRNLTEPSQRAKINAEQWSIFYTQLVELGIFLTNSHRRRIKITCNHRMSMSIAIGHAFKATRGFFLSLDHRDVTYESDTYPMHAGVFFTKKTRLMNIVSNEALVSVSIINAVEPDIAIQGISNNIDTLQLHSCSAIANSVDLALAVAETKTALYELRVLRGLKKIHLILKCPSFFSLMLGHRLNGICAIQLYDWIDGTYIPTIELPAN